MRDKVVKIKPTVTDASVPPSKSIIKLYFVTKVSAPPLCLLRILRFWLGPPNSSVCDIWNTSQDFYKFLGAYNIMEYFCHLVSCFCDDTKLNLFSSYICGHIKLWWKRNCSWKWHLLLWHFFDLPESLPFSICLLHPFSSSLFLPTPQNSTSPPPSILS